jgi:hypothetical protein
MNTFVFKYNCVSSLSMDYFYFTICVVRESFRTMKIKICPEIVTEFHLFNAPEYQLVVLGIPSVALFVCIYVLLCTFVYIVTC